ERDDGPGMATGCGSESPGKVFRAAHLDRLKLQRQRLGRDLRLLPEQLMAWIPGVCEGGDARNPGEDILQKFQALPVEFRVQEAQPCQIPAWPGKARDESASDGIADGHHDYGNRACRALSRQSAWRRGNDQDVNLEVYQLSDEG